MLEPLLGYDEMAAELGVPVRSLRQLVYKGIVPHLRLGHRTVKFQRSKVERALKKREVREVV
jgi:excisionase family DNA binding protein